MTDILDRVAEGAARIRYSEFRPKSPSELFAMRLATKLGDASAAQHYSDLLDQHAEEHLLIAYRRTLAVGKSADLARHFHDELKRLHGRNGNTHSHRRLISIRIERRAVAVAVSAGSQLEYARVRQLSSSGDKAIASAATFLERVLETLPAESAALEIVPGSEGTQRSQLQRVLLETLTDKNMAISYVNKKDVFQAFGFPPLRSRKELREIVCGMWPILGDVEGSPLVHDAVALGLYVQTERLFNIND